jgi:hypothetical protein
MSTGEWVGEDMLIMDDVDMNLFEYTACATTKLTTYVVNFTDLLKIPTNAREQMESIAKMRKQLMVNRILNLYENLKSIKTKLEVGENSNQSAKKVRQHHSNEALRIGN